MYATLDNKKGDEDLYNRAVGELEVGKTLKGMKTGKQMVLMTYLWRYRRLLSCTNR